MGNLADAVDHPHLIQRAEVGGEAAVHAEHPPINDGLRSQAKRAGYGGRG
jgi:hypothetical protein